jgi:carboxypeptidase C (cathepsin A)
MANQQEPQSQEQPRKVGPYSPPESRQYEGTITVRSGKSLSFSAEAGWIVLRDGEIPLAEMFYTYYHAPSESGQRRPLTFAFNGGPGASSAFLHMGALGPYQVPFPPHGGQVIEDRVMKENLDTWLAFTDIVCLDPVETGFSRIIPIAERGVPNDSKTPASEEINFLSVGSDLSSFGECIARFLTEKRRWGSSLVLCGESYGGYRAAKLAKGLNDNYGIKVSGIVLVSPALEFGNRVDSSYAVDSYVDRLPTMACTAHFHGLTDEKNLQRLRKECEQFSVSHFVQYLVQGDSMSESIQKEIVEKIAWFSGLSPSYVEKKGGRVWLTDYMVDLLKKDRKVCGAYDTSMTSVDPFPELSSNDWGIRPDFSFSGTQTWFTETIHQLLGEKFGFSLNRQYRLFNGKVFEKWKNDLSRSYQDMSLGSIDDVRYALSLDPSLKVVITHGVHDLVTPYFASERLMQQMRLLPSEKSRISLTTYHGGHMYYTHEESKKRFTLDVCEIIF